MIPQLAESTAHDFGFEKTYPDWRNLIAADQVSVVDIFVSNLLHHEIALTATRAGRAGKGK